MYKFTVDLHPDKTSENSILCHTKNDKFMVLNTNSITNWDSSVLQYKIDWWAYCEDVEYMLSEKDI